LVSNGTVKASNALIQPVMTLWGSVMSVQREIYVFECVINGTEKSVVAMTESVLVSNSTVKASNALIQPVMTLWGSVISV